MHGRWRCTYPILIIVLRLGLNDAQPLNTCRDTSGTNFPSTAVLSPKHGAYGRPGGHTSGHRVPPPDVALTTSRGLRPRNHVSRYRVYHPIQALTTARGLRSLMYGVSPPTRYLKKILGTREMLLVLERQHTGSPILGNI